jgi:hypothetical protein
MNPIYIMQLPPPAVRALELLEEWRPCDPDRLVPAVTPLIDLFRKNNTGDQANIRQRIESKHFGRLRGYATRIASRAVRTHSVEDVERGLVASALEGGRYDYRYTLMTLCLLYHSAQKLGADPDGLFQRAAALGDAPSQQFLLNYLADGSKSIEAMGYREGVDENGQFKYVATT